MASVTNIITKLIFEVDKLPVIKEFTIAVLDLG